MKLKTQGLSLKIPAQAVTTLVVAGLAYFGVDLDPEVSAALGVVLGFVAGYLAPAAPTAVVPTTRTAEAGQSGIQTLMIIALVLFIIAVVVWLL